MQGMSGSPVYINGRLVGAVALAFPFAKEPIAGVRPIEEMLDVTRDPVAAGERTQVAFGRDAQSKLMEISTPLSLAGFTRSAFDQLRSGSESDGAFEPMQGALGGGGAATTNEGRMGDPKILEPGSMISVLLMTGDMAVSADGTVTAIDGREVYAFGHRFLAGGDMPIPFARADGVERHADRIRRSRFRPAASAGVVLSIRPQRRDRRRSRGAGSMVPISTTVHGAGLKTPRTYKMQFVSDRTLSPLLAQMAIYSALDGTERSLGPGSVTVHGEMTLEGGLPPVQLDNVYSADSNAIAQAAVYSTIPLSYLAQSGLEGMRPKSITLDMRTSDWRNQLQVEQVWPSNREVHPGETIELNISLTAENGSEILKKVKYPVPVGAPLGTLFVTVSDGMTANLAEFSQAAGVRSRTPAQVIKLVDLLRHQQSSVCTIVIRNRVTVAQDRSYFYPPPSVALLLAKAQPTAALTAVRARKVAEFGNSISAWRLKANFKTTQVEVKEQ